MDTAAERRQFFVASAGRAGAFWLGYVHRHESDPAILREAANILQAILACQTHERLWPQAAELALRLHNTMMMDGQWARWEYHLDALLRAAGSQSSPATLASLRRCLGEVHGRQGHWAEAVRQVEQAALACRALGEQQLLGRCLADLAHWLSMAGRWPEVEDLAREAQPLGEAVDPRVLVDALILRGRACQERGELDAAIDHLASACRVAFLAGDDGWLKSASNFQGLAYTAAGRLDEALACFQQALEIARRTGDRPGQGVVLGNIGAVYLEMERPDLAWLPLEEALDITRQTDNRVTEAIILTRLGHLRLALGQPGLAIGYYEEALAIVRQAGTPAREAEIAQALARACAVQEARPPAFPAPPRPDGPDACLRAPDRAAQP